MITEKSLKRQTMIIYVFDPERIVVKHLDVPPFYVDATLLSLGALLREDRAWWIKQPLN
jgi:hypothetical protein